MLTTRGLYLVFIHCSYLTRNRKHFIVVQWTYMPKITVIAHNIRSTHNVGSLFRTCEGFGVGRLILSGYTPYPTIVGDSRLPHIREKLTAQIHKTALDAETIVPFEHHD